MLKEEFEDKFGDVYALRRCKENDCALKNVSRNKYYIIDGDSIKNPGEKSVDCIIINLNQNEENKYNIILCELTKKDKDIQDAIKRFKASGKLIINHLNEINKIVNKFDCLVLGNITQNGKPIGKKVLILNKFKIEGLNTINIIQNKNCGFDITKLES